MDIEQALEQQALAADMAFVHTDPLLGSIQREIDAEIIQRCKVICAAKSRNPADYAFDTPEEAIRACGWDPNEEGVEFQILGDNDPNAKNPGGATLTYHGKMVMSLLQEPEYNYKWFFNSMTMFHLTIETRPIFDVRIPVMSLGSYDLLPWGSTENILGQTTPERYKEYQEIMKKAKQDTKDTIDLHESWLVEHKANTERYLRAQEKLSKKTNLKYEQMKGLEK